MGRSVHGMFRPGTHHPGTKLRSVTHRQGTDFSFKSHIYIKKCQLAEKSSTSIGAREHASSHCNFKKIMEKS
jgi:hypothetical protein